MLRQNFFLFYFLSIQAHLQKVFPVFFHSLLTVVLVRCNKRRVFRWASLHSSAGSWAQRKTVSTVSSLLSRIPFSNTISILLTKTEYEFQPAAAAADRERILTKLNLLWRQDLDRRTANSWMFVNPYHFVAVCLPPPPACAVWLPGQLLAAQGQTVSSRGVFTTRPLGKTSCSYNNPEDGLIASSSSLRPHSSPHLSIYLSVCLSVCLKIHTEWHKNGCPSVCLNRPSLT